MGKRLSKIYTKTGDGGETGLGDGSRISKTSPRVEAMGSVDELNSVVGVVIEDLVAERNAELEVIHREHSQRACRLRECWRSRQQRHERSHHGQQRAELKGKLQHSLASPGPK